jgi:hypothetical protein
MPKCANCSCDSFDFYLTDDDDHDWLIIDGVTDRRAIAKDGGGGPYLLFGKDDPAGP